MRISCLVSAITAVKPLTSRRGVLELPRPSVEVVDSTAEKEAAMGLGDGALVERKREERVRGREMEEGDFRVKGGNEGSGGGEAVH